MLTNLMPCMPCPIDHIAPNYYTGWVKKTAPLFLVYVCVCLDSFKYFWWTKITFFLILCPWGKKWVVNLFCQPSRKLNYWDFLFGYKKTKIKIYWIDMELLNCEWIYKYKNNDISAPVRLSVKFDHSFPPHGHKIEEKILFFILNT